MEYMKFLVYITSVFSIAFFQLFNLMQIRETKWFNVIPSLFQKIFLGIVSGLISFCTIWITIYVFGLANADGKNTIILLSAVIFGYEAAAATMITIIATCWIAGIFDIKTLIIQLVAIFLVGALMRYLAERKGLVFIKKYLILFYLITIPISVVSAMLGGNFNRVIEIADEKLLLAMVILFFALFTMFRLFLVIEEKNNNKKELEKNHYNLSNAYEELTALEEELRLQMNLLLKSNQEIVHREQVNQLLIRAGNEEIWNMNLINGIFQCSESIEDILREPIHTFGQLRNLITEYIIDEDREEVDSVLNQIESGELNEKVFEFKIIFFDKEKWIRTKIVVMKDVDGQLMNIVGSFSDITEKRVKEERLDYLANYDLLTELPNRHCLYNNYSDSVQVNKIDSYALIYLDLDNFKSINDTMGHATGDILLKEMGKRLYAILKQNQFIARIGGDEFAIVIPEIKREKIIQFVNLVKETINQKFIIGSMEYTISCSIGISIYSEHGTDLDELMRASDIAMYHVKENGKNGFAFFDSKLHDEYMEKLNLEKMLREGIENHEICAYFQPKYDKDLNIAGFEALARWISPIAGMVSPAVFIPLAEQIGMIREIRNQVLLDTCDFLIKIHREIPENFEVSVNISTSEILQDDFIESILDIVHGCNVNPKNVGIEITESTLMESFDTTCEKLNYLKNIGIKISLDDFGTGYSSLNYLSRIPADIVKIDKSFIDKILTDTKYKFLIKTVIGLSLYLNFQTVAEGVEEKEQLDELFRLGCDYIQGFYLGKPLSKQDAIVLVQKELLIDNAVLGKK